MRSTFLESGYASVVADGPGKRSIEVGIIGREGMTGLSIVLGDDRSPHETYIQLAGFGHRMSAARLLVAIKQSNPFCAAPVHFSYRRRRRRSPTGAARPTSA